MVLWKIPRAVGRRYLLYAVNEECSYGPCLGAAPGRVRLAALGVAVLASVRDAANVLFFAASARSAALRLEGEVHGP